MLNALLRMHWASLLDLVVAVTALPEVTSLIPPHYLSLYIGVRAVFSLWARHQREGVEKT